ncbi:nucleotidyltransferase family protein [Pseudomonas indica]|uniref:Molybdenum cofactor cytidylyltransferase n=1 Tax=Pseudomonas indica TaxID=137658 RepID=A0A1G9B9Q3_9PSED|nr:nucleotidyltransferase family protein [Pseudomonas indica]SDK36199.1 molybdenum cofactor cytidylyltransferase [Pseudomonas indica]
MHASPQVIALVLAAGRSRRFGSDKRAARLPDGQSLLAATLVLARRNFPEVAVVLRSDDEAEALGVPSGVRVIRCTDADLGMGHSLAAGVAVLAAERFRAMAVMLGDMPWIADASLRHLAESADVDRIVFPLHDGQRGHPVLFGRRYWQEMMTLTGDQGARRVLEDHEEAWFGLEVDDPGVLRDADTPAALV